MTELVLSYYMQEQVARADNWMPMIAGASPEITSIDALWQTIRETPFYVPREAFRIAAREWQDHEVMLELVNRLPENSQVPRLWMKTGFQHMRENYLYTVTYTGDHTVTGKEFDVSISIFSQESLTLEEIRNETDVAIGTGRYNLEITGLSSQFTSVYHKRGADW